MARTTTTGRLLTKGPSAKASKMSSTEVVDEAFVARWNGLEKAERRQVRRLVRIGRPQETVADAELAVAFAAYQRTRPWYRFFYLWIVPIALAGIIAGMNLHPLVVGMVFGAAAVAVMSRRNYKRVEKVNAPVLAGDTPALPAAA